MLIKIGTSRYRVEDISGFGEWDEEETTYGGLFNKVKTTKTKYMIKLFLRGYQDPIQIYCHNKADRDSSLKDLIEQFEAAVNLEDGALPFPDNNDGVPLIDEENK